MFAPTSLAAIRLVQAQQERSRGEPGTLEGVVTELCRQPASEEALVAVL